MFRLFTWPRDILFTPLIYVDSLSNYILKLWKKNSTPSSEIDTNIVCKFHFITIENLQSPDKFHKILSILKLIVRVESCWFWKIFMSYWLFDNASFTANIRIYHSALSPRKSNQIICCLPNTEHSGKEKKFQLQLLKSLFSGVIQIDIIWDPDREKGWWT